MNGEDRIFLDHFLCSGLLHSLIHTFGKILSIFFETFDLDVMHSFKLRKLHANCMKKLRTNSSKYSYHIFLVCGQRIPRSNEEFQPLFLPLLLAPSSMHSCRLWHFPNLSRLLSNRILQLEAGRRNHKCMRLTRTRFNRVEKTEIAGPGGRWWPLHSLYSCRQTGRPAGGTGREQDSP